ncbi:MAG: VanZ family protein [Candidatus Acidiferrales bacterium]
MGDETRSDRQWSARFNEESTVVRRAGYARQNLERGSPPRVSAAARWWPVLAWAIVISLFSTHLFTSDDTLRFILPILHWLFPGASRLTLSFMHFVIRKCAHFVEYFLFSLLILRALRGDRKELRLAWVIAAVFVVAGYAALDEFHQSFVPGRTAALSDVLIDTTGGVAAQAAVALAVSWAKVRRGTPNG